VKFEAVIKVTYEINDEEASDAYGTFDPGIMAQIDQEAFQNHPESLLAMVGPEGFTVEVRSVK
jgi:hypothetical protein